MRLLLVSEFIRPPCRSPLSLLSFTMWPLFLSTQYKNLFSFCIFHDLTPMSLNFPDFRKKSKVPRYNHSLHLKELLSYLLEDTQLANARRIRPQAARFSLPSIPPNTSLGLGPFSITPGNVESGAIGGCLAEEMVSRCDPKAAWEGDEERKWVCRIQHP